MKILTINGNSNIKQPATMQVDVQDIDSSETGRNQSGNLIRDRVAGGSKAKRKVSCTWKGLTQSEISTLLNTMSGVSFSVNYPDPFTGNFRTATMYVGDRSAPVFRNGADSNGEIIWESLSANFVEL